MLICFLKLTATFVILAILFGLIAITMDNAKTDYLFGISKSNFSRLCIIFVAMANASFIGVIWSLGA